MSINVGEVEATLRLKDEMSAQAASAASAFKSAMASASLAADNFVKSTAGITAGANSSSAAIKSASQQFKDFGTSAQNTGRTLSDAGSSLTKALTIPITLLGGGALKAAIDFESGFAGVRKTMKASEAEFATISEGIREMARRLPVGTTELNNLGMMAGQLGISKEHIVSFTETAAKLGSVTTMSADDAANGLARLRNVMGSSETDVDKMGAALVALGNAGASSEREILDMSLRISGAGASLKMSEGDVMGLANALSSVGINAEMGGSAISRIMIRMADAVHSGGEKLAKFAQIADQADVSGQKFAATFKADAGKAVADFITGLGRMKDQGVDLIGTIADLDVKEIRMRDTLMRVGNAGTTVADSMALGNKAFQEGTALNAAFEERMKTVAAQLKVVKNQLMDVGIELGEALMPLLRDAIGVAKDLVPHLKDMAIWFGELPDPVKEVAIGIGLFGAAIGPIVWTAGQLAISVGALSKAFALLAGEQGLSTAVGFMPGLKLGLSGVEAVLAGSPFLQMLLFGGFTGVVIGGAIALVANQADKLKSDLARLEAERLQGGNTKGPSIPGTVNSTRGSITLLPETNVLMDTTTALKAFNGEAVNIKPILGTASTALKAADRATFGFGDQLKAARAEIARMSPSLRNDLAAAIRSGAFDMDEYKKRTGMSETALKLFEDQIKETDKTLKTDMKDGLRDAAAEMKSFENTTLRSIKSISDSIDWIKPKFKFGTNELDVSATFGGATAASALAGAKQIKEDPNFATSSAPVPSGNNRFTIGATGVTSDWWTDLGGHVDSFSKSLTQLAQVSGDTFSGILKDISQVVVSFGMGIDAFDHMKTAVKNNSTSGKLMAGVESATSVWAATEGGGAKGIVGGAASGAMAGAAMGAAFAPQSMGTSIVVGAIAGAIIGWLRTSHMKADLKDLGHEWGVSLSDELVKTIQKDAAAIGELPAMLLHLDDVINEAGGIGAFGLDNAVAKTHDLFSMLETTQLTAKDVGVEFDKVFALMLPESIDKTTGLAKRSFLDLIDLAKRFGIESKQANDFIIAQSKDVATGFSDVAVGWASVFNNQTDKANAADTSIEKLLDKQAKLKAQIKDMNDNGGPGNEKQRANLALWEKQLLSTTYQIGLLRDKQADADAVITAALDHGQSGFDRMGRLAVVAFQAAISSGETLTQALDNMGPGLDALSTSAETFGFTASGAFDELLKLRKFSDDNKELMSSLDGLNLMMSGLNNTGLLTQSTFTDIGATATETFDRMVAGGLDGNQAMALMQPTLQTLWQLHKDTGFTIDENTQKLLDDAEAAGIVGESHKTEGRRMVEAMEGVKSVLEQIADFMGVNLVNAARDGARGVSDAFNNIRPHIQVKYDYEDNGPQGVPVIEMATGGTGRALGETWFHSYGNEDYAFSGEGQSFGDSGGTDLAALQDTVDGLRADMERRDRDLPRMLAVAIADAVNLS